MILRNPFTFRSFVRASHSLMSRIFSETTLTPFPKMVCPKFSTLALAKLHFFMLAYNSFSHKMSNTSCKCCKCSSKFLLYTKISSKNTNTNLLRQGLKIVFINSWNVKGALVCPNGITKAS